MPILKILGSPEILAGVKTDGRKEMLVWTVEPGKQLGRHAENLKRILTLPNTLPGMTGYKLYRVNRGEKGEEIDWDLTHKEVSGTGMPLQQIWVERDESVPIPVEEEEEEQQQQEEKEEEAPPNPPQPQQQQQPQPQQRINPPQASSRPPFYEAAKCGWITIRRKQGRTPEYYIPIAAPLSSGGTTNSLCGKCVKQLQAVEDRVTWSPVDEHPAPIRPNTSYERGWILGKLSYVKKGGKWVKSFGADWEDRWFKAGPNGLHYYSTDVISDGNNTKGKAKNSKVFTSHTSLIPAPSKDEFPALKNRPNSTLCFGLRFSHPEEALLMTAKDEADKLRWMNFLSSTLKKLTQDEAWAAESDPVTNKDLVSNTLARIADFKGIISAVQGQTQEELEEAANAERRAQTARAECEHLLRGADRGEGEVAKIMAQIRAMKKMLESEHHDAVRERDEAVRELTEAKQACEKIGSLLRETKSNASKKEQEAEGIKEQIQRLKAEKAEFVASRNEVFSRWRKMEEHHVAKHSNKTALLAFSPHDSPCHPLRVSNDEYPSHSKMLLLSTASQAPPPNLSAYPSHE